MAATNTFGLVRGTEAQDAWCRSKLGIRDLIWLGYGGVTPMPLTWSPSASYVPALSLPASWNLTNAALSSRTGAPECWHQCVPPAGRESDAEDAAAAAGVAGAGSRAGALLAAAAPVAGVCSTAVMAAAQSMPALISAEARATLASSATTCCSLGCQVAEWTAQPEVPAAIAPGNGRSSAGGSPGHPGHACRTRSGVSVRLSPTRNHNTRGHTCSYRACRSPTGSYRGSPQPQACAGSSATGSGCYHRPPPTPHRRAKIAGRWRY